MKKEILFIVLIGICQCISYQDDLVQHFPTWPDYDFDVFSGMLQLSNPEYSIHYILVESKNNPGKDPIILWLNGGPGCSSLLGFSQEIGPYYIPDGSFQGFDKNFNNFSWNNNANLLFFETPPGVGFSENPDSRKVFSDKEVAELNLEALGIWFDRFPHFKNSDF